MGSYNPNLPQILGQEWVPIRNEDITFSPAVNSFEIGTEFTLTTSKVLSTGSIFVNEVASAASAQTIWVNVYPASQVGLSGPIRSVIIPCNNGGVTGADITAGGGSVAAALYSPSDSVDVVVQTPTGSTDYIGMFFATNQYAQLLNGKRILGVSFLYAGYGYSQDVDTGDFIPLDLSEIQPMTVTIRRDSGINLGTYGPLTGFVTDQGLGGDSSHPIIELSLGETFPIKTPRPLPLNFDDLASFEASAANRYMLRAEVILDADGNPNNVLRLAYGALKVYYCEETRVAAAAIGGSIAPIINYGTNTSTMYSVPGQTINPVLAAGDYVVTLSAPDMGDLDTTFFNRQLTYPKLNGLRQAYSISSLPAIRVDIPTPVPDQIDEQFSVEESVILPQTSLSTSGGILTEVHVYGRQVAAQVFGSVYAQQELLDTPVGGSQEYDFVRFYARRWGNTTVPLTLTGQNTLAAFSVSITPDEFDDLDEILDGWKEVSLRFDTPPSMGSIGDPSWRFTAAGELAGNRWEILGASAPAVSGVPGNLLNLAPADQQLYTATYFAPTGATQELEWMPQGIGSPPVSGAGVQDDSSDLFLIFSQEPPEVSGFAVTVMSQALSGIGQQCEVDPCCIPSQIFYNKLAWTSLAEDLDPNIFGYYQIQRSDEVTTDWQTIMEATEISGFAFNDFEARIGIETSYRIRTINLYGFEGPWSDEVSATIPAPGVAIGCEGGHLLTFTTNEQQCGSSNLAYSSVWFDDRVSEDFTFPEANFVQLQAMYNRDYFTAFRPLERGGEQFSRTMLVQAAAISPPTLGDFRSLRNMAWESVNYVCVRDEDGNRWFATVTVPNGTVLNSRKLYMASVGIAEVTDVPTPVDAEYCLPPEPPPSFDCTTDLVGSDSFARIESSDWGTADLGGEWTEETP